MRSLALKLITAFLAVSLVGTVLIALSVGRATANRFGEFIFSQNQEMFVSELSSYYQTHGGWQGVNEVMPRRSMPGGRGMGPGGGIALVDALGRIIVPGAGHRMGDKIPRNEVMKGMPIQVDDETVGTLIVGQNQFRPSPDEGVFLDQVNRTLIATTLVATAVALFLGVILTRALTRPLQELTAATRTVAQGNLGHQVEVRSRDELGELATSFNQMSADLAQARDFRRQLTADVAHELRTPLSVILGHAEALHDGVLPPTDETFYIIYDEAQRLNHLVDDLRILSLAEANELPLTRRLTSPRFLIERVVNTHSTAAKRRNITLKIQVPDDLPEVDVDPDRMAQVFSNLLENALRHTPDDSTITLSAEQYEKGIRFGVNDDGSGIAQEDLPRVFDRFYRADKSRRRHEGGSGLGLAIVKSIVTSHNGRVWVESHPGQGATFIIELPFDQA